MKIGSCLLLLATQEDPLAASSIPLIASSGFDYAEVSLARVYSLSDQELLHYQNLFDQNHLPVEVFNNAIPRGLSLIGPKSDRAELSCYIKKAITLAKTMGVQIITMSGPNQRTVPDGFTREEGFPQYIDFLKEYSALLWIPIILIKKTTARKIFLPPPKQMYCSTSITQPPQTEPTRRRPISPIPKKRCSPCWPPAIPAGSV